MSTNYGVIQIPDTSPSGAGGQMIIGNDTALNDARGVRKVATVVQTSYGDSGYGSDYSTTTAGAPALLSEAGLGNLETVGYEHVPGNGAVNLQPVFFESVLGISSRDGNYAAISGGYGNRAEGNYAAVVGGYCSKADGESSIAGGYSSSANATSAIAFGQYNCANSSYTAVLGGQSNVANGWCSAIVGGTYCSANAMYCGIIAGSTCVNNASYSVILGGMNLTTDNSDTFGVVFGNGGTGASKGRSVLRGLVEKVGEGGDPTATLEMAVASLGSTSVALVEVDVIHANSSTSTFTFSQYLVKVIGTTPTVVDTKGDSSQGTFTMSNGKLIYTSANALTAMRATVRITAMADGSSSNYYYYNY